LRAARFHWVWAESPGASGRSMAQGHAVTMSDSARGDGGPKAPSAWALLQVAMAAHRAGDLDAAAAGYQSVLDRVPDNADALHLLGVCRHQRRANREAFELVSRAIAAKPNAPEYHNTLGMILRSVEERELAARSLTRALRLRPHYRDAQNNLALVLSEMRRYGEAETVLQHALAGRPDDPVLLTGLGRLRLFTNDIDAAIICFHDALKKSPEYVGALNNLGVALNLLGDVDGAAAALDRALALEPG